MEWNHSDEIISYVIKTQSIQFQWDVTWYVVSYRITRVWRDYDPVVNLVQRVKIITLRDA